MGNEVLVGLLGLGVGLALGYLAASAVSASARIGEKVTEFIVDEQGRVVGIRTYYRV